MSNNLYDKAREKFLTGQFNWLTDTIKVALLDAALYTPNFATDEFLAIVPGASIIAAGVTLTGKSATGGAADAADVTFSAVSGAQSEYLLLYKDTGDAATSSLIALLDSATGLPITPNGGDIVIVWDNSSTKILKL